MMYGISSGVLSNNVIDIHKFIKKNNPNRIYLDVDGVIWHSCQAVCDVINKRFDTNIQGNEILSWNFKELKEGLTDEDIEYIFGDYYFFKCIKWINGAYDFIRTYKDKITIVTKGTCMNLTHKLEEFDALGLDLVVCSLSVNNSKGSVNMDGGLLIDDCTNNLIESNATHKIQFLEYKDNKNDIREWTKDWKGLKMYKW